jgi:hypothetical protein
VGADHQPARLARAGRQGRAGEEVA